MKFTIQFQEFSAARGQWLTIVFVFKVGLFRFLLYIPRIIDWQFRVDTSTNCPVRRVTITQGVIIDDKPANVRVNGMLPVSGPEYNAWPNDELVTVFKNGEVLVKHTFDQIRERAK